MLDSYHVPSSDCPNVVMLSSTSLLHGQCVFNRNNTVATQQGMKTYWLCKSYRISMCRARCITHQGKIISATGVHNHPPHMRGNNGSGAPPNDGNMSSGNNNNGAGISQPPHPAAGRFVQNIGSPNTNIFPPNYHGPHHSHPISPSTPPSMQHVAISAADATSTMNPTTSHHFAQTMTNLAQHQAPSQQLLPPTAISNLQPPPPPPPTNNGNSTIMHHTPPQSHPGYEMTGSSSNMDHSRSVNQQIYDGKSLKINVNDDHIPIQNAAELSPTNMHDNSDRHHAHKSTSDQHQQHLLHQVQHHTPQQHESVQVIDSITISPGGNAHNFKMEPL